MKHSVSILRCYLASGRVTEEYASGRWEIEGVTVNTEGELYRKKEAVCMRGQYLLFATVDEDALSSHASGPKGREGLCVVDVLNKMIVFQVRSSGRVLKRTR